MHNVRGGYDGCRAFRKITSPNHRRAGFTQRDDDS